MNNPSVTVGIPAYNEEDHIERIINEFIENSYSNVIEILVADGQSTDRTREIVEEISKKDNRVKLIENPDQFQSYGLNRMIAKAKGEIFVRADAHCDYARDYIEKCVENLNRPNIKNAGGAARFLASNLVQAGTAISVLSVMGNGGAKHYNPDYEGYSDTVPMGCFWTSDLRALQGFKESNYTNEDAEINYRIRENLKGKIYISPDIKLWYYPRKRFHQLFMQYFRYGRGRVLTSNAHNGKIPFRSKAPFIFVGLMTILLLVDQFLLNGLLGSIYILSAVMFLLLLEVFRISFKEKNYFKDEVWKNESREAPKPVFVAISAFFVLVIMNTSHFMGYGYQIIKTKFFKAKGW
ncbi:MAG: glycosyltransferase family 2 protein [Balneola sp.]|uniref:glycosyltransferase family 2 protein n=1 Tax=Balneola sp. EhC07 TaxID=1849360 RepID=UPI00228760EA|nr:glycosyltransferase family 2 protein [Balneola sp. EhC07]